jgi:hypothetical protein
LHEVEAGETRRRKGGGDLWACSETHIRRRDGNEHLPNGIVLGRVVLGIGVDAGRLRGVVGGVEVGADADGIGVVLVVGVVGVVGAVRIVEVENAGEDLGGRIRIGPGMESSGFGDCFGVGGDLGLVLEVQCALRLASFRAANSRYQGP